MDVDRARDANTESRQPAWHCRRLPDGLGVVCEREELLVHVIRLREALRVIAAHADDDGLRHYAQEALDG